MRVAVTWFKAAGPTIWGLALLTPVLFLSNAAFAVEPAPVNPDGLETIELEIERRRAEVDELGDRSDRLQSEIESLRARSIAVARSAQDLEEALSNDEQELGRLEGRERALSEALAARRGQLGRTLAALQRLSGRPKDLVYWLNTEPIDHLRSGILLRAAVPQIEDQAVELRSALEEIAALRQGISHHRDAIAHSAASLEIERQRLQGLLAQKARLQSQTQIQRASVESEVRLLAEEASSLRELILEIQRHNRDRQARLAAVAARAVPPKPLMRSLASMPRQNQSTAKTTGSAAPPQPHRRPDRQQKVARAEEAGVAEQQPSGQGPEIQIAALSDTTETIPQVPAIAAPIEEIGKPSQIRSFPEKRAGLASPAAAAYRSASARLLRAMRTKFQKALSS